MFTTGRALSGAALFAAAITVAALSARSHPSHPRLYDVAGVHRSVTPDEVATWIIEGRRDFTVIDLRPPADFERGHIPVAVNCHHCHVDRQGAGDAEEGYSVDLSKKLVAYTETGTEHVELPRIVARHPSLMLVKGGWQAWKTDVLGPVSLEGVDDEARPELQRREARRAYFAGEHVGSGAAAAPAVVPTKRECPRPAAATAREGC
jgi:rhodanese-related sulfurtransferase